MTKITLVKR